MSIRGKILSLAPVTVGMALGVAIFIAASRYAAQKAGIAGLDKIFSPIPASALGYIGMGLIALSAPLLYHGFRSWARQGPEGLMIRSVSTPVYAGVSLVIMGTGFFLNQTGVVAGGLIWFLLSYTLNAGRRPADRGGNRT